MPHVVPRPADGKYWCCDFINKGFCEPEKHGIRMNYFLSCGLARFANLGVFGPSQGTNQSLSRRDTDAAGRGEAARNDAPSSPNPPPQRSGLCGGEDQGGRPAGGPRPLSPGLPWSKSTPVAALSWAWPPGAARFHRLSYWLGTP